MKYCKNCLEADTRPNSTFYNGICAACTHHRSNREVNWNLRFKSLEQIADNIRGDKDSSYDCIIGVSGGKDSTRQALYVRDKLNLNPLLVCLAYPPEQVTERGMANLSNLNSLGFDIYQSNPSAVLWKKLKRHGLQIFGNSFRSTELALFAAVPKVALKFGIKYIFWGENPALQLGDSKTLGKTGFDGNNVRQANTLSSGHDWMIELGYSPRELHPYLYPSESEFEENMLQIVYLGWFLGDWSEVKNGLHSVAQGLTTRVDDVSLTGDLYRCTALDEDFTPINQFIKCLKFGFGRVTDYVNEDIRNSRLTRSQGIELVEKYDLAIGDDYVQKYCDYLEVSPDYFWKFARSVANKNLFDISGKNTFTRKYKVGFGLQN